MLNIKKNMAAILLCLAAFEVNAAPDEGLLFYCNFDNSANAAFSHGDGAAKCSVPPEFQPGVRGQAFVIGGPPEDRERIANDLPAHSNMPGRNAYYAADQNIDVLNGTISFWLKPLDWSGADKGFNVLFRTQAGRNFFMLYKYFHGEKLLFLVGQQEKWTSTQHRIGHWKPGQWHHVAITWNPAELKCFIDGQQVCTRKTRFPLEGLKPVEPISVGPGGSWAKGFIGKSLVDEFRIHKRPLSPEEVASLYRQDAGGVLMDSGHVTVGAATPRMDGRITAFEYAFEGAGFSDLRGMAAKRQSGYALSYDRTNLYVAVQSELDPGRTGTVTAAVERVELFLSPSPGKPPLHHLVFTPQGGIRTGDSHAAGGTTEGIRAEQSATNGLWTLEATVPFAALGLAQAPDGATWRFNIAPVFGSPEETTSVAPVAGHLADTGKFLELRFRPDASRVRLAGLFDMVRHQSAVDVSARPDDPAVTLSYIGITDNLDDPSYGLSMSKQTIFTEGRSKPFQAPKPPAKSWILRDYALYEVRIQEARGTNETILCRARFVVKDERLPMKTLFFYTLDRRQLSVSAERRADGEIRARFLRPDGTPVWQAARPIPESATYFQAVFDLDFAVLEPGDYIVKIDHVAPDGTSTETWEQAYRIPGKDAPELRPYVDEEADKVPAPWTPVEVIGKKSGAGGQQQGDGFSVSTWGRTYDFSDGFLFSSLVSQGKEILAGPAVLRLNGTNLALIAPSVVTPGACSGVLAVMDKTADLGALAVSNRIQTHFDGYCEIAMTLTPAGGTQAVSTLSLDIPLSGDAATLVRDNRLSALEGGKSGAVGTNWFQNLLSGRGPFFWVGNDKVGFNWVAPSLEGWHCRKNERNVELIRQGNTLMMRLNLVDTPLALDAPRTIVFGFTLTPSRPLDRKTLRRRENKEYQMWCQPWQYFAVPDYDTADRAMIQRDLERAAKGADEIFLYNGDGLTSPFSPQWGFWEEEWRPLSARSTYGEWTGGTPVSALRQRNMGYTGGCINGQGFRNFVNWTRYKFFERAKTPLTPNATGYYFDTGVGAGLCENAKHGCAPWMGLDGNPHGRMAIAAYRELAINAYRMIRRTGPNARIYTHQGWLRAMPLQTFTDIIVGGEAVDAQVNLDGGYFKLLSPEMFRATFSPYIWGIKMVFLDMSVRVMSENRPDDYAKFSLSDPATRKALLHSYGYAVLHDVDICDGYRQTQPLRDTIWAAQDTLGWDEKVEFHPYWEQGAVKLVGPKSNRIMASAYTKEGKMLLAVLNDTDKEETVKLELDLGKLGLKEGLKGHDVWVPEDKFTLASSWEVKLPPRGFRLIIFNDK